MASAIPVQLDVIDWKDLHHQRIIAAHLVEGVYKLKLSSGPVAVARPEWESYGFKLKDVLADKKLIFGAIYEYSSNSQNNLPGQNPPTYVIAFRGTNSKHDIKLLGKIIRQNLHHGARCKIALEAVQDTVAKAGAENVWLAGHSLGSSIALAVGRKMFVKGSRLETYLFNPPFGSLPLEIIIKDKNLKHKMRKIDGFLKAKIAGAIDLLRGEPEKENSSFILLSEWKPHLFIHPSDIICSGYIEYFERRIEMRENGSGSIEDIATQVSKVSLFYRLAGKDNHEPIHLIPSALLIVNQAWTPKRAHQMKQWLERHIHCDETTYEF